MDEEEALLAAFGENAELVKQLPALSSLDDLPELSEADKEKIVEMMQQQFGFPEWMTRTALEMLTDIFEGNDSRDVRTTTLDSLSLKLKQEFMYLFDYGDEWRFKVRVHATNEEADPEAEYPRIVEAVGEAPLQYPDWDEGWDED
jgi:hypothetical protein